MTKKYILKDRVPVLVEDLLEWGRKFEVQDRVVGHDVVGDVRVSTVFLGLDHSWGDGPPLLFETMVFGGEFDGEMERCSTWEEAEVQHAAMLRKVGGLK